MSTSHPSSVPDRLNPALAALFQRLLSEVDSAEGSDWDTTDSLLDARV